MADYKEYYRARDIIVDILKKDMIGPVKEDEILDEGPDRFYSMGKLYPLENITDFQEEENEKIFESTDELQDFSISLSNQYKPSSMGITFALKKNVNKIRVDIEYAVYDYFCDDTDKWKRRPFFFKDEIDLSKVEYKYKKDFPSGAQLYLYIQKEFDTGEKVITVGIVNTKKAIERNSHNYGEASASLIYQPSIKIIGIDEKDIFTSVDKKVSVSKDPEILEMEMLYSNAKCYAQGHGCSVDWDMDHTEAKWIGTSFMPKYHLKQMKPKEFKNDRIFSMKYLVESPKEDIINRMYDFVENYSQWILDLESCIGEIDRESAKRNLGKCKETRDQLLKAISMLDKDSDGFSFKAFRLANEAMMIQRAKGIENSGGNVKYEDIKWYPFQLAFILLEMISFLDESGKERKKVDLLWFPTGGGKTEAYLGITAFVIFHRRLQNPNNDGVTVFMRYTLRLLTIQQFQRASMLIMACELLRRKYNLGGREISIGLWVGGGMTPNSLKDAEKNLKNRDNKVKDKGTEVYHIKKCPWCGHDIYPADYSVNYGKTRMVINCRNEECPFHGNETGIPLHIVDEDIYAQVPTFIVATIDKFAQIPLKGETATLFGISNGKKPPELIIQDELHLISGPVGTMTGIYELVVDKLCEKDGIPVKIIASTATIRNAGKQIKELYGRDFTQFPAQGLDINDSFFAEEASPLEKPERLYLGVMGTGTSSTNTFLRLNAVMLFATRYLRSEGFSDKVIDNFWTITDYFNTLRELGSTLTNVRDYVQSRYRYLYNTKFKGVYDGVDMDQYFDLIAELTSRRGNADIMQLITTDLLNEYSKDDSSDVYDFILSSNMISVGIDIGRLGVMIVNNQPKTNAEYIQSTSRVGRKNPGLVVTAYGQARSRDRSHYEQFMKYHSALYKYVEASSLTPFSDRSRDRALHAVYVSLCRYLVEGMSPNNAAGRYDMDDVRFKKIENIIYEYVNRVDPEELENVMSEIQEIKEIWNIKAEGGDLDYKNYNDRPSLLKKDTDDSRFRTMNSMRSVDKNSSVYILWRE